MKKLIIFTIAIICAGTLARAQYGNQFQYNSYFKTTGAFEYPSELGTDIRKVSVNLLGSSMYLGNSIADVNWMYNIATQSMDASNNGTAYLDGANGEQYSIPHVVLDHIVNNTPETNYLLGGATIYPPLAIAYKLNRKVGEDGEKKEIVTFSFNHRTRTSASYYFGKNLFRLIYQGNETFGTDEVNLTDINLGVHAYHEWVFGGAFPVIDIKGTMGLRGGFNLKYLNGYGGFKTDNADVFFQSSADGGTWTFRGNYLINAAYPDPDNIDAGFLTGGIGSGFGLDIGASLQIWKNLKAYMAINDIGSIAYGDDHSVNFSSSGEVVFEGVRVNVFSADEITVNYDTLLSKFNPVETNKGFNIGLPTRFMLGGEFGIGEKETRKGQTYFKHNVYFTYIQGVNRNPGNSVRPFINAAYGFRAGNIVSVGVNTGYGGVYGANIGAFLALKGGPVRFGIASNALLGGLAPSLAKGFDITFNLGIAI